MLIIQTLTINHTMSLQDIPQTVALIGKQFTVASMQSLTIQSDSDKDMTIRPADDNTDRIAATHSDAEVCSVAQRHSESDLLLFSALWWP